MEWGDFGIASVWNTTPWFFIKRINTSRTVHIYRPNGNVVCFDWELKTRRRLYSYDVRDIKKMRHIILSRSFKKYSRMYLKKLPNDILSYVFGYYEAYPHST